MDAKTIADFRQPCGRLAFLYSFEVNFAWSVKFIETKGFKKHLKSTDPRETHYNKHRNK